MTETKIIEDTDKSWKLIEKLQFIKGVGPKKAQAFQKEGFQTSYDLLTYFPRAYIDRSGSNSIKQAVLRLMKHKADNAELNFNIDDDFIFTSETTIIGQVAAIKENRYGAKRQMLKLILNDGSGASAGIIFWNRVNYFKSFFKTGMVLAVSGKPQLDNFNSITFVHPEIEVIDEEDQNIYKSGGILPKYKITENMVEARISLRTMRAIISKILQSEIKYVNETLPTELIKSLGLPEIKEAISNLHFPQSHEALRRARFRLKFEEIFYFMLRIELLRKKIISREQGIIINPKSKYARLLYSNLSFKLTDDQKKFLREAAADMQSGKPMNRLLQGDVGSGKTIAALLTILMVIENGYQCCFMAPTEILAEQHYKNICRYIEPLGLKAVLLTGGQKNSIRKEVYKDIEDGSANIIIGTHALFAGALKYFKPGLLVIDELHRFGVEQRAELIKLSRNSHLDENLIPHILVMTATPIPRTLTMTVYGDLDVSIIKTMPKNRKPIKTKIVFDSLIDKLYDFVASEIQKGRQAFIVYPLVEKSEKMELKAAVEHYEYLRTDIFPQFKLGLLHGQMHSGEKEEIMSKFLNKSYDILVATTVIEVGIDIPNASVIVIEDSERFGLSQLHQLRGRVGRGNSQSYCFLVTKDKFKYNFKSGSDENSERNSAIIRLKTIQDTTDGFKIAEVDLKLRGPGDLLGTKQSGLPDFKYIDLINDVGIIEEAKRQASIILSEDEDLRLPKHEVIRREIYKRYRQDKTFLEIA